MTKTIAFAGKGGVGKTTICGMLVQYLCRRKDGAVLAVDADANSNLNEVLGVEVTDTLGDIREDLTRAEMASEEVIPKGMTKADYAEMRFSDALTETDDFDLLVMGRTQGMIRDLNLGVSDVKLIVNRAPAGELNPGVREEIDKYGLDLIGVVPQAETVYSYDAEGKPSVTVPDDSPVKQAVHQIFDQLNV